MILVKPLLTEKSLADTANHRYTFIVQFKATKGQVKQAVENTFNVNVTKVRTLRVKPTRARSGRTGRMETKKGYKKAIVTLPAKQTIKLFEVK